MDQLHSGSLEASQSSSTHFYGLRASFSGTGRPVESTICVVWLMTTMSPLCKYGEGSSASAFLT